MSFDIFWEQYPRREGKKPALIKWNGLNENEKHRALEALPNHIKSWKTKGTEREFIPLPKTWIYQARWEDEIDQPKQQVPKLIAWWASDSGILEKGRELGIEPRPGESIFQFKDRIAAKIRNAA